MVIPTPAVKHSVLYFLFEILHYQLNLAEDLDIMMVDFLAPLSLDYTQMIRDSYEQRWPKIARQTRALALTYHTSYHALEVALRTNIGAKSLGIFVEKNKKNQFLQHVLLTAAKYHDYIQWDRGHLVTPTGFHTPEEETAATIVGWLIADFDLPDAGDPVQESIKALLHYFVKLAIGPGTTLLFGRDRLVNLSTVYYELETIAHEVGLFEHESNQPLIRRIQAATEVLGAMDKVSAANFDVPYYQSVEDIKSIGGHLRSILTHDLHLIRFFSLIPQEQRYHPDQELPTNLEVGAIMNIAHTQMEIELHRESEASIYLRDYIRHGQALYKTSEQNYPALAAYLASVLSDSKIADSFRTIYLDNVDAERDFARKLPEICHQINLKLHQLGYVSEHFESCYLLRRESQRADSQWSERLSIFAPDLLRSTSDSLPRPIHAFLDPQIFEKEVHILSDLKDYMSALEQTQQREVIQEILMLCICQPGIRYSNHPELIHTAEPLSPISCRIPLDSLQSSASLNYWSQSSSQVSSGPK